MYEFYTKPCQIGQIYDATVRRIYSATAAPNTTIKFGAPLVVNAVGAEEYVDNFNTTTGSVNTTKILAGIAVFDQMKIDGVYRGLYDQNGLAKGGDRVSVMNVGRIWVEVDQTAAESATAPIRVGEIAYVGANQKFTNVATSAIKAGIFIDKPTQLEDGTYAAPLELNLEI